MTYKGQEGVEIHNHPCPEEKEELELTSDVIWCKLHQLIKVLNYKICFSNFIFHKKFGYLQKRLKIVQSSEKYLWD